MLFALMMKIITCVSRTVVPTDIVNSVTIKLEPGLDQIIDTEAYNGNNINNNQDDQVRQQQRSVKSSLCC